jgi:hypothetical protein
MSTSIFGKSFSIRNSVAHRLGDSAVAASSWMSDSSIYMKIASGSSSRSGVFASVSSQVFFSIRNSVAHRLGDSAVAASSWMSDSSIYMKIASGSSSRSGVFASVSSQVGQKDDVLLYNQPTLSILDTKPAATVASIVSVVAANLDHVGTSVMMRFKMTSVESTMWVSNSVLLDRACAGLGGNSGLFVSVCMQSGALTMSVGGALGVSVVFSMARVLGSAGQFSNWISDSCIVVKTSRNVCSAYTVQASAGRLVFGSFTRSLTHDLLCCPQFLFRIHYCEWP